MLRAALPLGLCLATVAPIVAQVAAQAPREPSSLRAAGVREGSLRLGSLTQPATPAAVPPAAAPPVQGPAGQPPPYQPPSMRFDSTGMTLLDAIRLTLQHDPVIKLREASADQQAGVLQIQKGLFDTVFRANGSWGREQSELTDSVKADQQETRDKLAAAIVEVTDLTNSLTAAGALLRDRNGAFNNPQGFNLSTIKDQNVLNQMTILQSELILYKDILASSQLTDATVRQDIINLREVTVGKNIDAFNAQQATIAGLPGQLQTKLNNLGPTPEEQWDKRTVMIFEGNKLFRSGISVRPFVDLRYQEQNFVGKDSTDTEFGGMGVEPISNGKIGFDIVLPLLRGAGGDSVAAAERAARYDLEASRLAVMFQKSQSVLTTIQAYWDARAAADQVDVLRRSVEIEGELASLTRSLIAANEKPRSDEARVLAATADARSRYEGAQRQLNDARIALAQVMGVALADALAIPLARDPYPQPPADLTIDPAVYANFVRDAVGRRFDRQAVLKSEASGKALLRGAQIDVRPLLNVNASGWGTSVQQSSFSYPDWVFRSGSVGLDFEKPFGNNTARGLVEARRSALRSTQIDSANLERLIALSVIQLSESLKVAASRLKAAEEAVRNYELTMTNEQARLKSGDASLLDSILTEQQITSARLSYIAARQEYATLLAALRHEAGLLVQDGSVDGLQVVSVPPALMGR
jgi:outer membrane protein TolC